MEHNPPVISTSVERNSRGVTWKVRVEHDDPDEQRKLMMATVAWMSEEFGDYSVSRLEDSPA